MGGCSVLRNNGGGGIGRRWGSQPLAQELSEAQLAQANDNNCRFESCPPFSEIVSRK